MDVAFDRLHSNASVLGFYGFFDVHVAVGNANFHIVRCNYAAVSGTAVAYGNVARTHGHVYFVVSLYLCAYVDLARLDIHLHIMTGSYVFAHGNVALSESLQIHIFVGFHISAYHYVAFCNNRCVYIVACFDAVIYIDVAGSDCHVYILDSFHIRTYGNVAAVHGCVYILAGFDIFTNIDFSVSDLHRYVALHSFYSMTYRNIAFIRLHGQAVLYRQVSSKGNVTLYFRLRIERTFGRHVIRHHQVAVLRNQICVLAGFQFSILTKDDVIPIRVVLFTGGFHSDVTFYSGCPAVNRNPAVFRFQRHLLFGFYGVFCIRIVANMDIAGVRLHRNASVFGFYGFFDVYVAVGNANVHIVRRNYAAVSFVVAYGNVARTHGHVDFVVSLYLCAYGYVARLHVHIHIMIGSYICAHGNVALSKSLQIHVIVCRYISAYRNITLRNNRCVYIVACFDAVIYIDVAGSDFQVYISLDSFHIRAYGNVAAVHGYVYILVRSDVFLYVNAAGTHVHLHIVAGVHIRAHSNLTRLHVHIDIVVGLYIGAYGNIAINGGLHIHIDAGRYICTYCNLARTFIVCTGGQGDRAVFSSNGLPYFNIARLRLHGHVFLHGDVGFHTDIALAPGLHIQALARGHVVRHHQIAVGHDQVCVLAGCQLSVLGKDNAFGAFHILIVGSMYGNVAAFRGCLAINVNLALAGFQIHILFGHNRFHVFPIIANRNVAFCHLYIHIAVLSLHGLIYGYASAGGYIQRHIVTCHYVALAVAAAYLDLAGSCGHGYILACGDVFPDRNIAVIGRCGYIARHVNIPLKGYIAFLINRYGQVLFGQGIARYVDTAVSGMQGQVAARIQHAVLRDHDILIVLFIQRFYSNIAFLGLGRAVHGNDTVLNIQVDVLLRQDRVCCIHFTHIDIAVFCFYGYAGVG